MSLRFDSIPVCLIRIEINHKNRFQFISRIFSQTIWFLTILWRLGVVDQSVHQKYVSWPYIIYILINIKIIFPMEFENPDFMYMDGSIWHLGVWYYIFFSKNVILEYLHTYTSYVFQKSHVSKYCLTLF